MKLLLCCNCNDVFNLDYHEKCCKCGEVKGRYLDKLNAVYSGEEAVPLGFDNFDLVKALANQPQSGLGKRFEAFVIPVECETFVKE